MTLYFLVFPTYPHCPKLRVSKNFLLELLTKKPKVILSFITKLNKIPSGPVSETPFFLDPVLEVNSQVICLYLEYLSLFKAVENSFSIYKIANDSFMHTSFGKLGL